MDTYTLVLKAVARDLTDGEILAHLTKIKNGKLNPRAYYHKVTVGEKELTQYEFIKDFEQILKNEKDRRMTQKALEHQIYLS